MIACAAGPDEVARRLAVVRARIASAGGDPDRITIIGVTKGFDASAVRAATVAGLVDLGESYAQETVSKIADLDPDEPKPRWHWVGRMQRNKVRQVAEHVSLWHSVDRTSLAVEIARRSPGAAVLVQVNTSGEATKAGCEPEATAGLVADARAEGLDVRGLMTIAAPGAAAATDGFGLLARLADDLALPERSMGMSDDLEQAVAAGTTMVRIGTALFGDRDPGPRSFPPVG